MALEEQIVEWSASRPPWQRLVLRRVAAGAAFSNEDYDALVDSIVSDKHDKDPTFDLEAFPQITAEDPSVRLESIAKPEHVNAPGVGPAAHFRLEWPDRRLWRQW